MSATYLDRAEEAWDDLSLGEKLHELDEDSVRDFAASIGLADWCENPNAQKFDHATRQPGSPYTERDLWTTLHVLHVWCGNHPRFAARLDREAERQRTLAEEPDDWNDDPHPNHD